MSWDSKEELEMADLIAMNVNRVAHYPLHENACTVEIIRITISKIREQEEEKKLLTKSILDQASELNQKLLAQEAEIKDLRKQIEILEIERIKSDE